MIVLTYGAWFHYHVHNMAPKMYTDYRLYGLQYGAPQLFPWIEKNVERYDKILVSSRFFNAPGIFIPFYISEKNRGKVALFNEPSFCRGWFSAPGQKTLMVTYPEDLRTLRAFDCPVETRLVHTISDPTGEPLFVLFDYIPKPGFPGKKAPRK